MDSLKFLAFFFLVLGQIAGLGMSQETQVNKNEFKSLCGLINLAKNIVGLKPQVEKKAITGKKVQSAKEKLDIIIKKVKLIAISVDPELQKLYPNDTEAEADIDPEWKKQFPQLNAKVYRDQVILKVTAAKLRKIWEALTTQKLESLEESPSSENPTSISGEIGGIQTRIKARVDRAVEEANRALYGEDGVLGGSSGKTFGSNLQTASTTSAGISLVNDITALCSKTDAGSNECKNPLTLAHAGGSSANNQEKLLANWQKIEPACEKDSAEPTSQSIHRAIMNFSELLGANLGTGYLADSAYKQPSQTLGQRTESNKNRECGATSYDACLDYTTVINGNGIAWKTHLGVAAAELEQRERLLHEEGFLLHRAGGLEHLAELAYREAAATIAAGTLEGGLAGGKHLPQAGANTDKTPGSAVVSNNSQEQSNNGNRGILGVVYCALLFSAIALR